MTETASAHCKMAAVADNLYCISKPLIHMLHVSCGLCLVLSYVAICVYDTSKDAVHGAATTALWK